MDRRVFQPRPTGNEARRSNALGMAVVVLVAAWLWLSMSHDAGQSRAAAQRPASTIPYAQHSNSTDR